MNSRDDCLSIWSHKLESYKVNANQAIKFKLVRSESDLDNDESATIFSPEMTHQIFGESESIFGYKDLTINIFCTASKMATYVGAKYSEEIKPERCNGIQADAYMKMLSEFLQPGFLTNIDAFTKAIRDDSTFMPFGEHIHSYTRTIKDSSRNFEIYCVTRPSPQFLDYHERLQPFLIFFVDAASYISTDDHKWNYYLLYEKYENPDNKKCYAFVGYMTVYNFFAYPDKIRPRISQVIIMPPFQLQGHGTTLLQTFYKRCWSDNTVRDISVEDPSEAFQRVRDFADCFNCTSLPSFHVHRLHKGFSPKMAEEARSKLKISRKQARKVYEILRLKHTNCFNEKEYKAYRVDVKRRLNAPFQKNSRHMDRLCKTLKPHELAAALCSVSDERRVELLEQQFQVCVNDYRIIINRLEADQFECLT